MSTLKERIAGTYLGPYAPQIKMIEEAFEIPQLDKTRRIWVLLPHNYNETVECLPVLYLQDAQNLFGSFGLCLRI